MPSGRDSAESGQETPYIKQVVLQNFMCHGNFKLNLGPSMNVIVGTNGSGKSSILTGIMITLGGRAKTTSRADALSGLVQTGKTRAIVSLKIHIPASYRQMHQKYGNEVTVTRIINSKGSTGRGVSQYKLKDAQGREVRGSNAQEVSAICQHFGLYPDNELAMLSQENAKEFLVSATPRTKYDKLRKALLQNVIEQDRALVMKHSKEQEGLIERIGIVRNSALEKESKADEILGRARAHASASAQLKAIKLIMAWREANKVARQIQDAEQQLSEQEAQLRQLEPELDIDARRGVLEEQEAQLIAEQAQLADRVSELGGKRDAVAREANRAQVEADRTVAEVELLKAQAVQYEQHILDYERTAAELTPEVIADKRVEIEDKINEADQRWADASSTMRDEDAQISGLLESLPGLQNQLKRYKEQLAGAKLQVQQLQKEKHDLDRGTNAAPNVPANIKKLKRLVEEERWERRQPLGPLHQYIGMKDAGADFAPALERLWTNTLEGWWVETEADRQKLQELSRRCEIESLRIFKRKDDMFDYSSALPRGSQSYIRAVDAIETPTEAITRILVDLNHIENLVLVRSNEVAFKVTDNRIPGNKVKAALSMTSGPGGRRKYVNVFTSLDRTESSTIDPMTSARMKVGTEARLRQLLAELQEKKEELDSAENNVKETERSLEALNQKVQERRSARSKAEALRRRAEDDNDSLRARLMDLETQAKSFDLTDELESTRQKHKEVLDQIQEGHEALSEQKDELAEKQAALKALEQELQSTKQQLNELDKRMRATRRQVHTLEESLRLSRERYDRMKNRHEHTAGKLRSLQVDYDEKVGVAEQHGPDPNGAAEHVHDGDSTTSLNAETQALLEEPDAVLKSKLHSLRGQQEALIAAEEEIAVAQRMKDDAIQEFAKIEHSENEMRRLVDEIEQRQRNRDENEARAWNAIKDQICSKFKMTLDRRFFVGDVEIDDDGSKLITHATPGEASGRSTSTLSGGEKSFTQVALLMAVWSTMHVGFVAMDEYDVYMDKVNRSLSLQLLAQVVNNKAIQCVLITPQDIDARALQGIQVKIHRLAAARP